MNHDLQDERIPEAELERLRRLVLDEIGRTVPLRKAGRSHTACCPKHAEQTPSFHVFPARRGPSLPPGYHCFGCGWHGTIFDWVAWRDGLRLPDDFVAVVERIDPAVVARYLPSRAGRHDAALLHHARPPSAPAAPIAQPAAFAERPEGYLGDDAAVACLTVALGHYHALLWEDREALAYLLGRGLTRELLAARQVGVCPLAPGPYERLAVVLAYHGIGLDVARRIGLLDGHGREFFAGRITFPERRSGACIWANGRAFRRPPAGDAKYRGLPLPGDRRKPLVNWEAVQGAAIIGVTEGQMDELALAVLGLPGAGLNGAAIAGNSALLALFAAFERLYLFFDLDQAGLRARRAFLRAHGERVSPVLIPPTVRRLRHYLAWLVARCRDLAGDRMISTRERRHVRELGERLPRLVAAIDAAALADDLVLGDPAGLMAAFRTEPDLGREVVRALLEIARWFRPAWEQHQQPDPLRLAPHHLPRPAGAR
ncbi:MAG: hypothetical protein IT340_22085 [Chloroflexi bacterium]|nr:hypothetical protein [Chloroflexota bacterium]